MMAIVTNRVQLKNLSKEIACNNCWFLGTNIGRYTINIGIFYLVTKCLFFKNVYVHNVGPITNCSVSIHNTHKLGKIGINYYNAKSM